MSAPKTRHLNGTAGAVEAFAEATKGRIEPPRHIKLRPKDLPFWHGIIEARQHNEWLPADLHIVAQLARCQADIEGLEAEVDAEGVVTLNKRKTPVANPKVSVLYQLSQKQLALMRALRIGGAPYSGGPAAQAKRRQKQLEMTSGLDDLDDDLIPTQQ